MRALNDLTKQERLELYRKALKDWEERPNDKDISTDWGLCFYFEDEHSVETRLDKKSEECAEWVEFVSQGILRAGRGIFLGSIGDPIPRIAALKAMITQLEEEML